MRAALALAALLPMSAAHAGAADAEGTRELATATAIAAPCVSIAFDDVAVVSLPRDELERRVAARPAGQWRNEGERMALIGAMRAQPLLAIADTAPTVAGCRRVGDGQLPHDSLYLVAQLLDAGQAMVADAGGHPVRSILASRDNPQCQHGPLGMMVYALPDPRRAFLVMTACVV